MLQNSYDNADLVVRSTLIEYNQVLHILKDLTEKELNSVDNELCNLTPGPSLVLEYAVMQQRKICLTDLIDFFNTLIKENTTEE